MHNLPFGIFKLRNKMKVNLFYLKTAAPRAMLYDYTQYTYQYFLGGSEPSNFNIS